MKKIARPASFLFLLLSLFAPCLSPADNLPPPTEVPQHSGNVVATVKHLTRVKILESNNVSLRPGSIYDNATYFESLLEFPRPGFNYEFLDSGLGAAEPLYPMYQKGHQGSYLQLGKAFISEENRHIDHYSSMTTPEGCQVDGLYMLRGLNEYPLTQYVQERAEGYTLIVVRLEYYTRLRPDAQCGRHRANDPDPQFDPVKYMNDHHDGMSLADFPAKDLPRFEAKVSAIYHIEQTMSPPWPRFDLNQMNHNTLWYYPNGHDFDYKINLPRPQAGLVAFNAPKHMIVPATPELQTRFSLERLMSSSDFQKILAFLNGKPTPNFDSQKEPGHDTLRLSDVSARNFYTSGLYMENIHDVVSDVSSMKNYKLVGLTIKPSEEQTDAAWQGLRVVPQVRFVFQLTNPRKNGEPLEQLFLHLKWDVVDRFADAETRAHQYKYFLSRVDQLTQARGSSTNGQAETESFVQEFTTLRPVQTIAFSSALTGIWVFGDLTRDQNSKELTALKTVRAGVDVGYYSTTYDNDVFRAEIEKATGTRKAQLQKVIDDITVSYFRDPKRQDVHALNFNSVTCAQCHQTSGRDGIHMSFNDHLDRRLKSPINVSEYFFHEADEQLQQAVKLWSLGDSSH